MPVAPLPIPYALPSTPSARDCTMSGADIVVCGRRGGERQRIPRLEPLPEPAMPRAEAAIPGGGRAALETQARTLAPGIVSNGVMVTFRWPF